ncbi:MAG: hypothetical protein L6R37_008178 [Teloschistes peruensis]|nr:MAG: hypothetical protein L6R37_008178 [Teloschistes peruensis]
MDKAGGLAPRFIENSHSKTVPKDLDKREDEDDDAVDIAADGTGPIRDAVKARALYMQQATPTWYQIDPKTSDADATFTSFATGASPIKPDDPKQTQNPGNGDEWDVDHILELQVLLGAFKVSRPTDAPTSIPSDVWSSVSTALTSKGPQLTAIAGAITNLENLQGIPNADNGYKKSVVKGILRNDGKGFPGANTYFNFIGVGIRKYLADAQDRLFKSGGTAEQVGDQLVAAGGNDANAAAVVKTYFVSYASAQYSQQQSWISASWTGKTWDRPSATTSSSASSSSANGNSATVTCYHAADPQNACAAIADSDGWCDCGDDNKYQEMTEQGSLCQWTTLPPTKSFDCTTPPPKPTQTAPKPVCSLVSGCGPYVGDSVAAADTIREQDGVGGGAVGGTSKGDERSNEEVSSAGDSELESEYLVVSLVTGGAADAEEMNGDPGFSNEEGFDEIELDRDE